MTLLSLLLMGFVLWTTIAMRQAIRGLTAASALTWAHVAVSVMILAITLQFADLVPVGYTSSLHFLAATLMLAPLIDILGARNPGHRAWPWFVVLPMIAVLQWPMMSHLMSEQVTTQFELPGPALIGFALVLIMGAGNYFGTANTAACLIGATGVILFVLPVTSWLTWPGEGIILASSVCFALSALLAEGRIKSSIPSTGHHRLWLDFRDTYGLVWARRAMDRINQFSHREKWDVIMTLGGFEPRPGITLDGEVLQRPIEVLRWVLRRFATDECLDRLLTEPDSPADIAENPVAPGGQGS